MDVGASFLDNKYMFCDGTVMNPLLAKKVGKFFAYASGVAMAAAAAYQAQKFAKIPAIDIIDFDYPNQYENYWHTLNDIPANCSTKSLEVVGIVMTHFIYKTDREYK